MFLLQKSFRCYCSVACDCGNHRVPCSYRMDAQVFIRNVYVYELLSNSYRWFALIDGVGLLLLL